MVQSICGRGADPRNPEYLKHKYSEACELFIAQDYKNAFKEFTALASLLLPLSNDGLPFEIPELLNKTIACYLRLHPELPLRSGDLWDNFYRVMRRSMDSPEDLSEAQIAEEISAPIPLSHCEERWDAAPENPIKCEMHRIGPFGLAVSSARGSREEMEDAHLATALLIGPDRQSFPCFGVFDGHGGAACAAYVKERIPEILKEELPQLPSMNDAALYTMLRKMFIRLNEEWLHLPFQSGFHRDYSGTTATLALLTPLQELWIANVGDSRAVLVKEGQPIQLSEDAKAGIPKFQRELLLRGGEVESGRVVNQWGSLDMARSIGDILHPEVSAIPTIRKKALGDLKKGSSYLLLACDGLWDVVSPEMAAEALKGSQSLKKIAKTLETLAYARGSYDNVTVMVIRI